MEDKVMIADTLSSCNATINMLNYAIMQCDNKDLRDYFVGVRNQMEALQWQVYEYAKQNNYYNPAAPAGKADVEAVKQECSE